MKLAEVLKNISTKYQIHYITTVTKRSKYHPIYFTSPQCKVTKIGTVTKKNKKNNCKRFKFKFIVRRENSAPSSLKASTVLTKCKKKRAQCAHKPALQKCVASIS